MEFLKTKVFVLDTSVLVHDPNVVENLGDNIVVIPIWVIEELDKLKREPDVGSNARLASRGLDEYRKKGFLTDGVATNNRGTVFVNYSGDDFSVLPIGLEHNNDNRIIVVAKKWQDKNPSHAVTVVSKDVNLRLKANSCGIASDDYLFDKNISSPDELYSGTKLVDVSNSELDIVGGLKERPQEAVKLSSIEIHENSDLLPNQCCILKNSKEKIALAIFKNLQSAFFSVRANFPQVPKESVHPINDEQWLAYALLMDQSISLVTLVGAPGSGKTLISLLAGYHQLETRYSQILVYRPHIELGKSLGYLPGTIQEKFQPWMHPISDNFNLILRTPIKNPKGASKSEKKEEVSAYDFMDRNLLEISPITFIRGRSIHQKFVIIDEAQNLTPHEVKTIITRIGQDSKIVLTGDPSQIDKPFLDSVSNGLSYVVQRFAGQEIYGHITMKKTERSKLAELAARLL